MWAAWGVVDHLTGWLKDISASWWFLAVVVLIALLDSVLPVVPSETTVIIGGVAASAAGDAKYGVAWVIVCGALGAFLGDNLSCQIGRRFSRWVKRRAATRPATRRRLAWAARQIQARGGLLLVTARFVPGGRTAITLSCGITRQPVHWFATWVAVAVSIWASYAAMLGYLFGERFEHDHTLAFLLAFGAALSITAVIELVRWLRGRRQRRLGDGLLAHSGADEATAEPTS